MFAQGSKVKVEYQYGKFYEGTVLWTEKYSGLDWVTVRPDDERYVSTFGSAQDMGLGYKSYIANDPVLGRVFQCNCPA